MTVVMTGIDAEHVLELGRVKMSSRSTLASDAADPALGVSVRVRRLDGRTDHSHSFATEDVIEIAAEL